MTFIKSEYFEDGKKFIYDKTPFEYKNFMIKNRNDNIIKNNDKLFVVDISIDL